MLNRLLGWLFLLLVVSACAPQSVDTPIPTQTLIPATETPTVTPTVPTVTPQDLPSAQEYSLTPSPVPLSPLIDTDVDFDLAIVEQTQSDLAANLGVSPDQMTLVEVHPRLYYAVECPTAQFPVPPPLGAGLEVTWIVDTQTHTYLTWDEDEIVWCEVDTVRGSYLTAVDPIAAELAALAIRRVSQQVDVPVDDLMLVDALPVQWQDSSLGCPQAGQSYTPSQIDGYRIIISDGDTTYQYHTDSVQIIPCENPSN